MLRRHISSLILLAAAATVAGCSPSGSGNVTAVDNQAALALDNEVIANDEGVLNEDSAVGNDLLSDNGVTLNAANAN
ncbi:hypothetical protein NZL82_00725 [Sphingomonas sanguinis]|jgi:hypothetical protein|uniref:hypothetical protein n=1 Tax=Sphingomonas sp. LC-1 TaxID=3110957 RepID=UPI0021BB469A|nr:hypothetical protein [Sphingomonas sp. LC-1]MCT8000397.1 hypothetical protein [Sphingomonas sp. LC-1]